VQLEQGPQCRRCRADLSLLFSLRDQRYRVLARAYQAVARKHLDQALAFAREAEAGGQDEESRRLLAVVHLLRGEFAQAWQVYAARSEPVG
jgi:hypothetical protein